MHVNELGQLILTLGAAIIILLFFTSFGSVTDELEDVACREVVAMRTAMSLEYDLFAFESDLIANCPRRKVEFFPNNATISKEVVEEKKPVVIEYNEFNQEEAFEVIGGRMVNCWKNFGEGSLDTFHVPKNFWDNIKDVFKRSEDDLVGCRICDTISFEDFSTNQEFEGDKFVEYLKNNRHKNKFFYNILVSDSEYLQCNEKYESDDDKCWEVFAKEKGIHPENMKISTNQDYFVTFVRENPKKGEGTLNVYLLDKDMYNGLCDAKLPFRG
jgi:hypothetical protein